MRTVAQLMLDARCWILEDSRHKTQDSRLKTQDSRLKTQDSRQKEKNSDLESSVLSLDV
jgi:hypothetical protein